MRQEEGGKKKTETGMHSFPSQTLKVCPSKVAVISSLLFFFFDSSEIAHSTTSHWQICIPLQRKVNNQTNRWQKQGSCFGSAFPLPPIEYLRAFLYLHSPTPLFYPPPHTPPTTFLLLFRLRQGSGRPAQQRERAQSVGTARTEHVGGLQWDPLPALIPALYPKKKDIEREKFKKREGGWRKETQNSLRMCSSIRISALTN